MRFTRPWYELGSGDDGFWSSRRFDVALVLSILLHGVLLFAVAPHVARLLLPGEVEGPSGAPLTATLVPPSQAPKQPPQVATAPAQPSPPVRRERPPTHFVVPPMAALPAVPSPDALRVPAPTLVPTPAPPADRRPPSVPMETDLTAYIAARRAERGESRPSSPSTPTESEAARRDRVIAQNLATLNSPRAFTGNPKSGGGLFQVTLKSYDFAEFKFYGWNSDIKRTIPQRFEVRKGTNPTIDLAIVRRMIEVIRQTEKGDFVWRSERLGKDVTLSARVEDNDALETFLLKDLFG